MRLCSIASGSSGNCIYVGSENTSLLIDTGISGKKVEFGLNSLDLTTKDLDGIFVTHEHSDHIKGLGVIARKCGVPIYATAGTIQAMEQSGSLGKMPDGIFHEIQADETCRIGDLTVHPFHISHDAADPVAYKLATAFEALLGFLHLREEKERMEEIIRFAFTVTEEKP